ALGSRALLATERDQFSLEVVKKAQMFRIDGDTVSVPAVQLTKEGVRGAYNMVVLIVSPDANYVWRNADGTVPSGLPDSGSQRRSFATLVPKQRIEQALINTNGLVPVSINLLD
ncbi:MAG: hypothetical protein N2578_05695, partial [Bdellovibrionaceae bacterium]|nr:hypothetical protein [Pseudobdellovibrionaceae bacterium]